MGSTHVTLLGHMIGFMSFDWLKGLAQLTRMGQLMDFTLWLTMSYEPRDAGE